MQRKRTTYLINLNGNMQKEQVIDQTDYKETKQS